VVSVCIGADLWKYGGGADSLFELQSHGNREVRGGRLLPPEPTKGYEENCRLPVGSGAKRQQVTVILLFCSAMKCILEQKCELFGLVAG